MSWPFGETGVGKMGDRPPIPQALRTNTPPMRPTVHISALSVTRTAQKYIGAVELDPEPARLPLPGGSDQFGRALSRLARRVRVRVIGLPLESKTEGGQRQKASLCRRRQPKPFCRLPELRAAHGPLHRPLPELRLQAVAFERDGVGGLPRLAGRRPRPR